jgi:four helix bundle protein
MGIPTPTARVRERPASAPGDERRGRRCHAFLAKGGHGAASMSDHLLPFQKLDVYKAAKELAKRVHEASIRDAELRDQASRASKSVFLGICEGLPSDSAGVRRRHFEIANNSLHEVIGAVDLAGTLGVVEGRAAGEMLALASRIKAMLRKLPR